MDALQQLFNSVDPIALVIVIVAITVVVIGVLLLLFRRTEENLVEQRFNQIEEDLTEFQSFDPDYEDGDADGSSPLDEGRRLMAPVEEYLMRSKFGSKQRRNLARADLKLKVYEFLALQAVTAVAGFLIGVFVLFPGNGVAALVAGMVGLFAPRFYVGRKINKRLITFEEQLPDTLSLWTNALRSGYSVMQSMEAIAVDSPEPTSSEFKRVVKEVQIGIDMQDALDHLLERMDSPDLDLVITAVSIQREVGGNLAEILEVIGHTIRERIKIKGEIRVLTSQGRITGYLISFLPIILALFLYVISPDYMGQMFEDQYCGWPMIGLALALIGIGMAAVQKIIDIDV